MKKYFAKFENESAYDEFKASEDFVTPNVSWCVEEDILKINRYVAPTPPLENNNIYYTSSNGEIVIPAYLDENNDDYEWIHQDYPDINDASVFGANIVSNTYENGQGVITFDGDVTLIDFFAFDCCYDLASITIPDSVTLIDKYAFDGCTSLSSITVSSGNTFYDSRNNCNAIIETAINTLIQGCVNTAIPDSVTGIGYEAFAHCSALSSITIPDSVTTIGEWAFTHCSALSSVTIGSGVTTIGRYAFGYCTSLFTINYEGTTSQWNNITIGNNWNYNVPATAVHCTDGDIVLIGDITEETSPV